MPRVLRCYADNCGLMNIDGIKLFYFPTSPYRSKLWVEGIGKSCTLEEASLLIQKQKCLCERHFTADQFTTPEKKRLNRNAIPSIISSTFTSQEILESSRLSQTCPNTILPTYTSSPKISLQSPSFHVYSPSIKLQYPQRTYSRKLKTSISVSASLSNSKSSSSRLEIPISIVQIPASIPNSLFSHSFIKQSLLKCVQAKVSELCQSGKNFHLELKDLQSSNEPSDVTVKEDHAFHLGDKHMHNADEVTQHLTKNDSETIMITLPKTPIGLLNRDTGKLRNLQEEEKVNDELPLENALKAAHVEDEFDVFAKSIAVQLRKLPKEYALEVQGEIQNLLVEKHLKALHERNTILLQKANTLEPFVLPPQSECQEAVIPTFDARMLPQHARW